MKVRLDAYLLAVLAGLPGTASLPAPAYAEACTSASEGGYEITRCHTSTNPPLDSVGWKKTDREMRVGSTPETDGNSSTFVMVVGTFAKKCPTAEGKVGGSFEWSMMKDDVDTDEGETRRTRYANRLEARLEGQVGDNGELQYVEIEGEITNERDGTPRERGVLSKQRFTPGRGGEPDWEAAVRAVKATGDLSPALAILWSGGTFLAAELEWRKPNACVELAFDPPSNAREIAPGEAIEVRTWLRTFLDQSAVGKSTLEANSLGSPQVSPRKAQAPDDGVVTFRYTAPQDRRPPRGFDVNAIPSRAGFATGKWRALDGLKLTIEHRLLSRRDTPHALAGWVLYDGTVRFEINLEPFPTLPGEFRGETQVVRQLAVGHITPRCAGQGSQAETWRVNATVDATSGMMKLALATIPDELTAFWVCDGQRSEVTSRTRSELKLNVPLSMSSRSGSRQTFTPSGPLFQETLTVTIP